MNALNEYSLSYRSYPFPKNRGNDNTRGECLTADMNVCSFIFCRYTDGAAARVGGNYTPNGSRRIGNIEETWKEHIDIGRILEGGWGRGP
ncbi:unnamed protein product [Nezara viridula]|uniref:Uncharacterized protein n=1 Tax=Nezara viridula TaxID=85310 RepID=A0A9P0H3Z5_NEZVI|nr:unnamed protein product [Nezara viridula]